MVEPRADVEIAATATEPVANAERPVAELAVTEPAPAAPHSADATAAIPRPRGLLSDDMHYAVYLLPGALESLGETIAPYLTQGPHGPHLVCSDFDTGGALCEMTVETPGQGDDTEYVELMFPVAMIRLVVSVGSLANGFGFRSRVE